MKASEIIETMMNSINEEICEVADFEAMDSVVRQATSRARTTVAVLAMAAPSADERDALMCVLRDVTLLGLVSDALCRADDFAEVKDIIAKSAERYTALTSLVLRAMEANVINVD